MKFSKERIAAISAALDELERRFPKAFSRKHPKPLAIGVHESLLEQRGGVSKKLIKHAIQYYTRTGSYLHALKAGGSRYDLGGQPVGDVTKEQSKAARKLLTARRSKPEQSGQMCASHTPKGKNGTIKTPTKAAAKRPTITLKKRRPVAA